MRKLDTPITIEQNFKNPPAVIWKAITDIHQMRQWYFGNIPDFRPEVGFETQFEVHSTNRIFLHQWKITEVVHLKKITYNWKYDGYPGDSFVTFELFPQDNRTLLRLTTKIEEDFPQDIPEFTRESCEAGWIYFIQNRLKNFLNSTSQAFS